MIVQTYTCGYDFAEKRERERERKAVMKKPARCRRWSGVVCSDMWLKLSRPWARELGELCGENHGGRAGMSVAEAAFQEEELLRRRLAAIEVRLPCRGGWLRRGSCRWPWPRPPLAGDRASSESLPIFSRQPRDEGSWLSVADSFVSWMDVVRRRRGGLVGLKLLRMQIQGPEPMAHYYLFFRRAHYYCQPSLLLQPGFLFGLFLTIRLALSVALDCGLCCADFDG
jgi:hypothetical protein